MEMTAEQGVQTHIDSAELEEWYASLDSIAARYDSDCVATLLHVLRVRAGNYPVKLPIVTTTPYLNTIPAHLQPDYPGDLRVEKRIRDLIRWNAMAMVVRANQQFPGIGGHLASYASATTLFETGFNHLVTSKLKCNVFSRAFAVISTAHGRSRLRRSDEVAPRARNPAARGVCDVAFET